MAFFKEIGLQFFFFQAIASLLSVRFRTTGLQTPSAAETARLLSRFARMQKMPKHKASRQTVTKYFHLIGDVQIDRANTEIILQEDDIGASMVSNRANTAWVNVSGIRAKEFLKVLEREGDNPSLREFRAANKHPGYKPNEQLTDLEEGLKYKSASARGITRKYFDGEFAREWWTNEFYGEYMRQLTDSVLDDIESPAFIPPEHQNFLYWKRHFKIWPLDARVIRKSDFSQQKNEPTDVDEWELAHGSHGFPRALNRSR